MLALFTTLVDGDTPRDVTLAPIYRKSEAYYWVKDDAPLLLLSIVETLEKDRDEIMNEYGVDARNDIKRVVARLLKIRYEVQKDKRFLIFEHEEPDKRMWNRYIENLRETKRTFFGSSWLDAEHYLYRKISSFFSNTYNLQEYDCFAKMKQNKVKKSMPLFNYLLNQLLELPSGHESLLYLFKLNLWHIKIEDMLSNVAPDELTDEIIQETLSKLLDRSDFLLINDAEKVWDCLINGSLSANLDLVVHIILGDCGFQLFVNFLIATFLIDKKLATTVIFHPKALPYRITDATFKDINWFLDYLSECKTEPMKTYGEMWLSYLGEGKFKVLENQYFWTMPYPFYRMRDLNANLYNLLRQGQLLIFCGDMNYRKLLGDFTWDIGEDFLTCLRGFLPANLVAIRTIGTPIICGVSRDGSREIAKKCRDWLTNNEYGLIQFCPSEACNCIAPGDYLPGDAYFDIFSSVSETCSEKFNRLRLLAEEEMEYEPEEEAKEEASTSDDFQICCYDGTPRKKRYRYIWKCRKITLKSKDIPNYKYCRTLQDLRQSKISLPLES